jgi:hypothetical protein
MFSGQHPLDGYYKLTWHYTLSFCQGTNPDGLLKNCLNLSLTSKGLWWALPPWFGILVRVLRTFTCFPSMARMQLGKFHGSQKSFTICDKVFRLGVGITSCFKCFIIDLHTSWTILCTAECPRRKVNEIVRKLSAVARYLKEMWRN